jgi:Recombination endonuclease VII
MSSQRGSMYYRALPSTTTNSESVSATKSNAPVSRQCHVCGEVRFAPDLVASKRYRGGYMPLCKPCRNEYWRQRRALNPDARKRMGDAVRRTRLLTDYGMKQSDYERMLKDQDCKCKLCGVTKHGRGPRFRYWNIDHSHDTGKVRGLLCHMCNITIGKYERLVAKVGAPAIAKYLEQ